MHKTFPSQQPLRWPKVIREAYAQIWYGNHPRIIIKAPRGGGKSKLLGTIGFDLWYLKNRKVVTMGGSFVQAEIVYNYFRDYCDIDPSIALSIKGGDRGITMSETEHVGGNTFACVTASAKQVRGKHPDILISDETCETSDELIDSALPMVNDSENPQVIMASTFHKIFGRFAETWDNAQEMGYHRIQWDIFDVCAQFAADIWERPEVAKVPGIQKLKAFAKGRTGDPDGWVKVENIIQAWREKPTEEWFEVEYLGTRPSSAGLVLKPEDVDCALIEQNDAQYRYVQGAEVVLGIDWGFSTMTAVTEVMRHLNGMVVLLDNRNYHQTSSEEIIAEIVEKVKARGIRMIYADSAGKFENLALQNALSKANIGCAVIEVVFSKEKESMLGNLRAHFEQGKIKLPRNLRDAFYQLKNYRYQEGTDKPVKKNDHIPDALMCALQHFKLNIVHRALHVQGEIAQKRTSTDVFDGHRPHYDPLIEHRSKKPITAGLLTKKF